MQYLALWQSFVGALGAFAVAAFTVWQTNRMNTRREERQATREREAERRAILRGKLERLVESCEKSYIDSVSTTTDLVSSVRAIGKTAKLQDRSQEQISMSESTSMAIVTAHLYFPTLAELVNALHRELSAHSRLVVAMAEDAVAKRDFNLEAAPKPTLAKKLRFQILDESRRLIESDFDISNSGPAK